MSETKLEHEAYKIGWEVLEERRAQNTKWGEQNHLDGTGMTHYDTAAAKHAKELCQDAARRGSVTWRLILQEEVSEAFAESDLHALRAELIQIAAVAQAWVEAIDRTRA